MMANTFMYAIVTLNYNKVMRIITTLYKVASIIKHYRLVIYNQEVTIYIVDIYRYM